MYTIHWTGKWIKNPHAKTHKNRDNYYLANHRKRTLQQMHQKKTT